METIQNNSRVVVEYVLKDEEGEVLDASDAEDSEPITYVHGYGLLVPGLEAGLEGLTAGATKSIVIDPAEGFGEHDEDLVGEIDRGEFPEPDKVAEGDEFVAESSVGEPIVMRVVEVRKDSVIVDANHPLAGVTLHYDVKIREVRSASPEEIAEAKDALEASEHACGCGHDHDHDHGEGAAGHPAVNGQRNDKKLH